MKIEEHIECGILLKDALRFNVYGPIHKPINTIRSQLENIMFRQWNGPNHADLDVHFVNAGFTENPIRIYYGSAAKCGWFDILEPEKRAIRISNLHRVKELMIADQLNDKRYPELITKIKKAIVKLEEWQPTKAIMRMKRNDEKQEPMRKIMREKVARGEYPVLGDLTNPREI